MPTAALRAVVVLVGVAVLALVGAIATNERSVVAYQRTAAGDVVQVPLTCGSIGAGGGVVSSGQPTDVDEAPEGVTVLEPDDGYEGSCPEEGPVWLGVLALIAVLVVGATVWAWQYAGHRARVAGSAA